MNKHTPGLAEIASKIIADEPSIEAAKEKLLKEVIASQLLKDECIELAINEAIYSARHRNNHRIKYNPAVVGPTAGMPAATAKFAAAAAEAAIFDRWVLPNGQYLGDVTGNYLLTLAVKEQAAVAGHQLNVAFYNELGKRAKGRRIREVMSSSSAATILSNIHKTLHSSKAV